MNPDPNLLRYIVILIDSKIKDHSGKVFCDYNEAKKYTEETIVDNYADKAIIGMFLMDPSMKEMLITMIETVGFKGDNKNVNQLKLFTK